MVVPGTSVQPGPAGAAAITPAALRRLALALPEVQELPHFQSASFRVGGKIFATLPPEGGHAHLFVGEDARAQALALHPAGLEPLRWGARVVGLRVDLAGCPAARVRQLLQDAWLRKAPKALVRALAGAAPSSATAAARQRKAVAPAQAVLYGAQGSGSAAIECALRHCAMPYRRVRAATWEPDSALGELARVNPLGQIPTLVLADGRVLTESAAILIHLGLTHPRSGLLPAGVAARAQAIRALVFIAANCYAAIGVCDYPERWTTATTAPARDKLRQGARLRLHAMWDRFADSFEGTPFLNGAAVGAADYLAAVVSRWSGARAHLARSRPAFSALLGRIEEQPTVAEVFARHWPA